MQWIPEIHLWCDTCWLYRGQHGSWAFLIHVPTDVSANIGRGPGRTHDCPCHKHSAVDHSATLAWQFGIGLGELANQGPENVHQIVCNFVWKIVQNFVHEIVYNFVHNIVHNLVSETLIAKLCEIVHNFVVHEIVHNFVHEHPADMDFVSD